MSHSLIAQQQIGGEFSGTYYVESSYVKQTVQNKDYTDMVLRDKSGSRNVKYWGTVKGLTKGCWIFVSCIVDEYQGGLSITTKNVEITDEPEELENYLPIYEGSDELADDMDNLREELLKLKESTGDATCTMIVDEAYRSAQFFDRFIRSPGSDGSKYGKQGGLLASVVRVARHSFDASDLYELTDDEKAVMLTAALLYRVGVADSYEFVDCMPVKTKNGILLGEANMTMHRVNTSLKRALSSAKKQDIEMNQETIIRILHCIIAANNTCGIKPMTKEALVLHGVAILDGDVVDALDFMDSDINDEEFTAFDTSKCRQYYLGE